MTENICEAILIILVVIMLLLILSDTKESFVPRIMRRVWDNQLNPTDLSDWYWNDAEHPGLTCADSCFNRPDKQACLQACNTVYDIPTYKSYYAMRARGLLAY